MSDPPLKFIDYPKIEHLAKGDMVLFEGNWRRVVSIEFDRYEPYGYTTATLEGVTYPYAGTQLPRIAAPLLDALRNTRDHPYRT